MPTHLETQEWEIELPGPAGVLLEATLTLPSESEGLVLFAHGSGSSRFSVRNQRVARALQNAGLSTLLLDLLSEEEERTDERTRQLRFDIELLAERLLEAARWL